MHADLLHSGPRRSLTRRAVLGGAAALGGAALFSACRTAAPGGGEGGPAATARPVTIRAQMVEKQDVSAWIQRGLDQDIDGFKQKNPHITVVLDTVPGWTDAYIPKIIALSASDQLGDLLWYPPRHRSHLAWGLSARLVRDLTPLVTAAKYDLNQFYKGALEHNTWEGKLYWLSYISEPIVPVIAYNKTKLNLLGIPEPKDDWTFDELAEWARRGTGPDTFGYFRSDAGTSPFSSGPYLRQWGVEPVDKTGKRATFMDTRDAFIAALTFRYNLMNTWKVSPNPAAGSINVMELFGGQRLLAVDIWPFRIQIYPDTFRDFEIGIVLTPVVRKGDRRRSMLNEHVFGITTTSKAPEEAFKVLAWLSGKEMNVQGLVQGQKGPIARPDVWTDQRIYDKWPAYAKLRPIMEQIEPDFPVANFRGEEFDSAFAGPYNQMERGNLAPAAAAAEIQERCQAVLDKEPS